MKSRLLLSLLFIPAFGIRSYSQSDKDSLIRNIRQTYQQINNDKSLHTVTLTGPEFLGEEAQPDNGAELKGYFNKDTLCRMVLQFGLSYAARKYDYYFSKGQLVFVYETEEDYPTKSSGGLNYDKMVLAFEGRYYYNNGKLIKPVFKGKKRAEGNTPAEYVKDLPAEVKKYMKILQQHAKDKQ